MFCILIIFYNKLNESSPQTSLLWSMWYHFCLKTSGNSSLKWREKNWSSEGVLVDSRNSRSSFKFQFVTKRLFSDTKVVSFIFLFVYSYMYMSIIISKLSTSDIKTLLMQPGNILVTIFSRDREILLGPPLFLLPPGFTCSLNPCTTTFSLKAAMLGSDFLFLLHLIPTSFCPISHPFPLS